MQLIDKTKFKEHHQEYFLEFLEDSVSFFVCRNRLKYYIEYTEEETWEDATGRTITEILLVCESKILEQRTIRFLKRYLENVYEDITFLLTSKEAFENTKDPNDTIWRIMDDATLDEVAFDNLLGL
jgi:hypothetical protein